ncbi:MBOAT family O-acyltransferase [Methylohalobius crimeensis]|uniref:MBOAT family O-acyltransferase n=1 Tax=Methylohalobius crimeensis TaxID=244365 RepID=UPI0003B7BA20|nr:MBOAT family protein [Methylohalobius crimeensis]
MLFNSYQFIFAFFPLTLLVFILLLRRFNKELALGWLVIASLFFYGWWNPAYLGLIIFSILANYTIGKILSDPLGNEKSRRLFLTLGICLNLALLGYYKYANFFITNINALTGSKLHMPEIFLPLAISFFTFQQIAYLVDAFRGVAREQRFLHYSLFVTFFPQLIAGPIVHHQEMLPQFMRRTLNVLCSKNLAIGITIFSIGLFKKGVLADGVAAYASPVFDDARTGGAISLLTAWSGALAYTMQLYFDFSGYSDMAIGGARMFGIVLPLNFNSPYKATSIIEFWRRWHITLSRFLRDYLYIPLGGNRNGSARRYLNLMVTMLLGGLWHGAGWTFVVWGGLHGFYLFVNHVWHKFKLFPNKPNTILARFGQTVSWLLTFFAVVVGWVFFRSADLPSAMTLLSGMSGVHGVSLPNAIVVRLGSAADLLESWGVEPTLGGGSQFVKAWSWIIVTGIIALFFPNTQEWLSGYDPNFSFRQDKRTPPRNLWLWKPSISWAVATGVVTVLGILTLSEVSEFLYFQF